MPPRTLKEHALTHIAIFTFTQFFRYIHYNLIAAVTVICGASLLIVVLILLGVFKSTIVMESLQMLGRGSEFLAQTPIYQAVAARASSLASFSVIVFFVGTIFHYTLGAKKLLSVKQAVVISSLIIWITYIFIAAYIPQLIQRPDHTTAIRAAVLAVGFVLWFMVVFLILSTRATGWFLRKLKEDT